MRGRGLLLFSLTANLALALGCFFLWRERQAAIRAEAQLKAQTSTNVVTQTKLMPVYRKQFFSWSEIESADYEEYIKNLRDIGCPEQTIHDIIVEDVNGLYLTKRMAVIVATDELAWWQTEFDPVANLDQATLKKLSELAAEQSLLLTRLLGEGWQSSDKTFSQLSTIEFDGAVLGRIPARTRQAMFAIMGRAEAERIGSHLSGIQSEQTARRELADILTPEQLEEFLLRYSHNADSLRAELGRLKYFSVTRNEFRALFRATDEIDSQIGLLAGSDNPSVLGQIQSLKKQRELAVRVALTPIRYAEYTRLQDPAYREAVTATLALGGSVELAKTLYSVNQQVVGEQARIQANTNLTDLQKQIELKKTEMTQLEAQAKMTGQLPIEPPKPEMPPVPEPLPIMAVYSLVAGDEIRNISARYRIPMSAIRAANPGLDLDNLQPGDKIRLPEPSVRQSIAPFGR